MAPQNHPGLCEDQKEQSVPREDTEFTNGRLWFPKNTLDTLREIWGDDHRSGSKQSLWEYGSVRFWLL